jgi:cytoskeletal protein RodZ
LDNQTSEEAPKGLKENSMTIAKRMSLTLTAAIVAGTLLSTSPLSAKPASTPTRNTPTSGSGCFVTDANGASSFDASCSYHLTWQTDSNGDLLAAMYHDHGQLPPGAALPKSTIIRDISFDDVRCQERITPSGEYTSECYAQVRSQ